LNQLLLTGDMVLYRGLIAKGYTKVVTFEYVRKNIIDEEREKQ